MARLIWWLIAAWLTIGATLSLAGTARIGGVTLMAYRYGNPDERFWRVATMGLVGLYAAAAMAIAMSAPRWRRVAGVLCCTFGISFLIGLFVAQSPGLWTRNSQMSGEPEGHPPPFEAFLAVAAPVAILAFRIGRMGATTRQVWWSGVAGVALPIAGASTLAAVAKMCGARLHWKPSLPLDFMWAMTGWTDVPAIQALWIAAGLTTLGSSIVLATWFAEMTGGWNSMWKRPLAIAAAAGCALAMELLDVWGFEVFRPWCWTVLVGGAVLGAAYLLKMVRRHQ